MTFILLVLMGTQVATRLSALRSAPQDNVQWALAQVDVELLALDVAARKADANNRESLKQLRQRFDVFYSRVKTVAAMPIAKADRGNGFSAKKLSAIQDVLDRELPIMNGADSTLAGALPSLITTVEAMRAPAREITLAGVKAYAADADASRGDFSDLLGKTALVNSILILALGAALLVVLRQTRISKRRASELQASSDRNANTINASLDAIVVMDMNGKIIDFNPAATQTFGYSRNAAIGAPLAELLIPSDQRKSHQRGFEEFRRTGVGKMVGTGRKEMMALHADGKVFPVEMSLGSVAGPDGPLVIAYIRNITERIETERNLLRARDEALEGVRAKSQFLAVMSHEMRTPLNGVMALLDLIGASKLNAKQKTYVKTAVTSAEILKQHVDDVLDLTRIQAGKFELFPQTFDFVELLEEVQSINYATAKIRGNQIRLDVNMPEPYFVADRKRIHQVLTNLVGNAIKFTKDGDIHIEAKFVDAKADVVTVEVSVTDTGIGVPPEEHQHIFEDFVTLDTSYQRNAAGAGLGLPICRSIIEAMSGIIGMDSEQGRGSRFWFRIPLKAAFGGLETKSAVRTIKPALKSTRRLKVLLVEDNETNRFVASELLMAANCEVTEARDGIEGVTHASKKHFDLILMDLSMPRMNGWDAARKIRATALAKSAVTPIFALTAQAQPEELADLLDAGIQGCILKPLRAKALNELLEKFRAEMSKPTKPVTRVAPQTRSVDPAVIEELRSVLGDVDLKHRLKLFCDELHQIAGVVSLHSAPDELAKAAHKFAGSAAVFGAMPLRNALLEVERSAKSNATENLAPQIALVNKLVTEVISAMQTAKH